MLSLHHNGKHHDLVTFAEGTSIGDAKHAMAQAIHTLAGTTMVVSHDQAAAS